MGPLHSGSGVDKGDSRVDDFHTKVVISFINLLEHGIS